CSAALFTASGELLVQAEHIPVHLGSMPAAVAGAIEVCGAAVGPGDQILVNDPYAGGTHLNDITLVAPVFAAGQLVGWTANRAHPAGAGGIAPGSIPPDALVIEEGGRGVPPTVVDDAVEEMIAASSRAPAERRDDLAAQRGANAVGAARLVEVVRRLGSVAPLQEIVDYGERRMRPALRAIPEGVYHFDDWMDSTGPRPEQQRPVPVVVSVTVDDATARFDFSGTGAQQSGNANAVEAVTVSAVAFALRCATDPTIPANGGAMRPVSVHAPPGSIVAASDPAAVAAGNLGVSQRVAELRPGTRAQAVRA